MNTRNDKVLVYGAPFTGKSTLSSKLSEHFNLIWIDLENGHDVIYKLPQEWQDRITLVDIPDTRSFPIAIETCLKMVKGPVSICNTHGKVDCMICKRTASDGLDRDDIEGMGRKRLKLFTDVDLNSLGPDTILIFDSLTQLTNSAIAHITKDEDDLYKLDYDDWGNLGKLLDIFLSHIQQARYHVVCNSHDTEAEQENGKVKLFPVCGTRNFSRNVAKYFDHVVYAEVKNKKHFFTSSTTYASNIIAGSRTDIEVSDSLLQIFKPELYPDTPESDKPKSKLTSTKKAGGDTKAILEKIRSKQKLT